jgi:hypothetical protein
MSLSFIFILYISILLLMGISISGVGLALSKFFDNNFPRATLASIILFVGAPHFIAVVSGNLLDIDIKIALNIFFIIFFIYGFFEAINKGLFKKLILFVIDKYVIISILVLYLFVGGIFIPSSVDEIAYHIPQAAGAFQLGKLYSFDGQLPWIKNYPQGAALLWGYFIYIFNGDYFARAPQVLYLIQILLAVSIILANRGIEKKYRDLAIFIILTMPVVYILGTTNKADLGYSAAIISFIALLYPSGKLSVVRLVFSGMALSQAISLKVPVLAVFFFLIAIVPYIQDGSKLKDVLNKKAVICSIIILALLFSASYVYLINYISFQNPFYPIAVKLRGIELFQGPLSLSGVSGHTTFGALQEFSLLRVWHAIFFDVFSPLNEDSYGSAGIIFGILIFPQLVFSLLLTNNFRDSGALWKILMAISFSLIFLLPSLYQPRYHLIFLIIMVIISLDVFKGLNIRYQKSLYFLYLILMLPSIFTIVNNFHQKFSWVMANGIEHYDRGLSVQFKYPSFDGLGPLPKTVEYVRTHLNAGDRIYVGNDILLGLLWNLTYSNEVIYYPEMDSRDCLLPSYSEIIGSTYFITSNVLCKSRFNDLKNINLIEIKDDSKFKLYKLEIN